MKKISTILFTLFLAASNLVAQSNEKLIEEVIVSSYIEGMNVDPNVDKVINGFHPKFHMYAYDKGVVTALSREKIIELVKAKEKAKETITYDFTLIDVVGSTAIVKLIVYKDNKLTFTDYISLYKFEDGWKIIAKLYESH